ncbi:MAG: radical SAM protein, partial [Clostridiales bacterium]
KEIVLTGVNIGDFGKSTAETFFDLLKSLLGVQGIERFRISSIEPELLSDEIISLVASSSKLAKHFHIPLQSGCNRILALMRRRYNRELYAAKVKKIRELMPLASIGADVIVGFPGETKNDFDETLTFLKNLDVSYLHVFPFSERKNTPAAMMNGKVSPAEKEERSSELISLSKIKKEHFYERNVSLNEMVIFESRIRNNKMQGFTSNYVTAETEMDKTSLNKLVSVKMKKILENGNMEVEIS